VHPDHGEMRGDTLEESEADGRGDALEQLLDDSVADVVARQLTTASALVTLYPTVHVHVSLLLTPGLSSRSSVASASTSSCDTSPASSRLRSSLSRTESYRFCGLSVTRGIEV
jgi:hypothetical protein